ncbi:uncharacterized protein LOC124259284 isoform X1 [Haliotis rubra]|uniref:uncharacterized protein LOC124259284 isoform X1 n=1 Tax=Haliotis rubra TaxID=36100 RepID=UPI001EE50AAD|nr:uncharacterized protein LOC124259284 isoform X1 [Haliotis rubra]
MMGLGSSLIVIIVLFSVRGYEFCDIGSYFDPVIHRCDLCSNICDNMDSTNTYEDCQRNCPDYGKAKGCSDDQYYDQNVGRCDSCAELCHGENIQDTTEECKAKCPSFHRGGPGSGSGRSTGPIIATAVTCSITVMAIVIVLLLCRTQRLPSVLQRCRLYPGKGYTQPQQCSDGSDTSGSNFSSVSDVHPQVTDATAVVMTEQEGFPDLHTQARHSIVDVLIH